VDANSILANADGVAVDYERHSCQNTTDNGARHAAETIRIAKFAVERQTGLLKAAVHNKNLL